MASIAGGTLISVRLQKCFENKSGELLVVGFVFDNLREGDVWFDVVDLDGDAVALFRIGHDKHVASADTGGDEQRIVEIIDALALYLCWEG